MDLSKEAAFCFHKAFAFATQNGYEFVTPEMLLAAMTEDHIFRAAFEGCGGDIKMLRRNLDAYICEYVDQSADGETHLSVGTNFVLNFAAQSAQASGSDAIHVRHLIHAIWNVQDCFAVYFMERQDISEAEVLQEMSELEEETAPEEDLDGQVKERHVQGGMQMYAPCLNDTLGDRNPLIGREDEMERTIQILCRRGKNNPLHIGEPGVGKTALTYGLVQRIVAGRGSRCDQRCKGVCAGSGRHAGGYAVQRRF